MGQKIRLKAIKEGAETTGVYDEKGKELPVGHEIELPDDVDFETSGYQTRAELIGKKKTAAHTSATAAPSGTEGAGETHDHESMNDEQKANGGGDTAPAKRYEARETSPGWYAVFEGDTEVEGVAKMRKADADEFNGADEDTRAKFVAGTDSGEAV